MQTVSQAEKKSSRRRGNSPGFWFFEIFIRIFGLHGAYGFLYFVCLYYLIFDRQAVSSAMPYISRRFPDSGLLTRNFHTYRLFISQGRQLVDRLAAVVSKKQLFDIKLKGYDELLALFQKSDHGVILLTSHFGNWQIALTSLNKLGKRVYLLMREEENPAVRNSLNVGNEKGDIRIISPERAFGGVIEIMNVLRRGHVVSIMGDRSYGAKAFKIDFLGEKALFPFSAFAIAAAAECPVVILLAAKDSAYGYSVDVTNILVPCCKSSRKRNEQLMPWVQEYANILEKFIQKYPYQCFLFHDIWKS
jgi:predicted LPLAT superfamily acyltransferase